MFVYSRVLDRDLADHDGGGPDLDVAVEDGEDPGVPLDLVADQVGQGVPDRPVELADDDLGLGGQVVLGPLDQRLARPQDDPLAHRRCPFRWIVRVNSNGVRWNEAAPG